MKACLTRDMQFTHTRQSNKYIYTIRLAITPPHTIHTVLTRYCCGRNKRRKYLPEGIHGGTAVVVPESRCGETQQEDPPPEEASCVCRPT